MLCSQERQIMIEMWLRMRMGIIISKNERNHSLFIDEMSLVPLLNPFQECWQKYPVPRSYGPVMCPGSSCMWPGFFVVVYRYRSPFFFTFSLIFGSLTWIVWSFHHVSKSSIYRDLYISSLEVILRPRVRSKASDFMVVSEKIYIDTNNLKRPALELSDSTDIHSLEHLDRQKLPGTFQILWIIDDTLTDVNFYFVSWRDYVAMREDKEKVTVLSSRHFILLFFIQL